MTRNFLFTAVSVGSRLLVSAFLFFLLARVWGPEQFGTFSFVFSVCALLMLTVDFGFSLFLLREISADSARAPELIAQGLQVKLMLTALMLVAAGATVPILGSHTLPVALYLLLLLAALLLSFAEFCIAPLRAFGRYDMETALTTSNNALQFLLAGGIAWLGGTPVAVATAIVVSRILYLLCSWRALARIVPIIRLQRDPRGARLTMQKLWPYGVDGAFTSIWSFLDVIAVRMLFGAQAAGLYAAGQRLIQGVIALAPVVGNVMIPRIARQSAVRAPDTWRLAAYAGLLMAGIGLTSAIPLVIFPDWIVRVVFGTEYAALAQWLPWFGAILFVRYSGAAFGTILSAVGLQTKRILGQILALCVYAASILISTITQSGVVGALLSLLAAMLTMGSVYALQVHLARRRSSLEVLRQSQG